MRIRFHRKLDDLKERLLVMAGMAEQAIQRAVEAYRVRDLSLCDLVVRSEISINSFEREIDQMALDLLAMEQPMAIDLRFILAVIKINADLERVGDQAVSISDRVRDLQAFPVVDLPVDIPRMASLASAMVRKALQGFIEADAELATSVLTMDDSVDKLNDTAFFALSNLIKEQPPLHSAGAACADDRPQPGAGGRSRHQHRGRCHLLGPRRGCSSPPEQLGLCEFPSAHANIANASASCSAAAETALFLCDENIGRKFEPGTQFAHLVQGELPLVGQEHRNRTLRSELRDQITLCKSLLFNQETHH